MKTYNYYEVYLNRTVATKKRWKPNKPGTFVLLHPYGEQPLKSKAYYEVIGSFENTIFVKQVRYSYMLEKVRVQLDTKEK